MEIIKAITLKEAYDLAREKFNCSVNELEIEVVQHPTRGMLGLFKKNAIIAVSRVSTQPAQGQTAALQPIKEQAKTKAPKEERKQPKHQPVSDRPIAPPLKENRNFAPAKSKESEKPIEPKPVFKSIRTDPIVDSFNRLENDPKMICEEIEFKLKRLFSHTCYQIETIEVSLYDDKTLKVLFDGQDAALLIGKDGYRYKALSYILFNWINPTYGYLLRLEIAEFLHNQEEMIARYLEPVIATIEQHGKGQTRVLDGVLVQIALRELRERFPGKYVAIKSAQDGEGKYVVVNDFIRKHER
ncbi:MAG: Jag N-terminal domain-containing protein [Helicobacteraceae bacterium]|jgi:spoIIIJ-associated protein|nr:Jag N-terminal domain-containing protein [Helicobacteraceae bacterium]